MPWKPILASTVVLLALVAGGVAQQRQGVERVSHGDDPPDAEVRRVLDRLGLSDATGTRQRGEVLVVEATDRHGVRRRLVLAMPSGAVLGDQVLSARPRRD